ncbi:MAG: PQQ-binding-like beta-propeller repeat protein [Terriglobia bacterium]
MKRALKFQVIVGLIAVAASVPSLSAQQNSPAATFRSTFSGGSRIFGAVCLNCHGKIDSAPLPAVLKQMPPSRIYEALTTGSMRNQAKEANLTEQQIRDIAEWVGGRTLASGDRPEAKDMPNRCSSSEPIKDMNSLPSWNGWSNDLNNARFQSAKAAGLTPAAVSKLQFKWAFAFPGSSAPFGQPTIVGGRVFAAADSGYVYSLDAKTGCVYWSFQAQGGVASAILIEPKTASGKQFVAYFGDIRGNVYAVDTANGELLWKTLVDSHPVARVRGGIKFNNGRLYVPVASLEEPDSAGVNYPCCSFRGAVVALNADTGKQIWKTYTIDEQPTERKTSTGKTFIGPAGAGVWGPTMLDLKRKAVYVSTGNAFSEPDTGRSDALISMDMNTGKILWAVQDEAGDVWHTGCPKGPPPADFAPRTPGRGGRGRGGANATLPADYYCPETPHNPDWDFSAGVMMATLPGGKNLLIAGQKSGVVWAHDPDKKGALVWKSDINHGEIVFGGALDEENAYFGVRSGGIAALRLTDGSQRWYAPAPPQESMSTHPGFSAALSVIPGVVFAGGLDGTLHAFSTSDGRQLWAYDTTQELKTVNGISTRGGSIGGPGPTIAGGMVFVTSGYTGYVGGQPGNLMLAFGPPAE